MSLEKQTLIEENLQKPLMKSLSEKHFLLKILKNMFPQNKP
jgi:hypothetical protein